MADSLHPTIRELVGEQMTRSGGRSLFIATRTTAPVMDDIDFERSDDITDPADWVHVFEARDIDDKLVMVYVSTP